MTRPKASPVKLLRDALGRFLPRDKSKAKVQRASARKVKAASKKRKARKAKRTAARKEATAAKHKAALEAAFTGELTLRKRWEKWLADVSLGRTMRGDPPIKANIDAWVKAGLEPKSNTVVTLVYLDVYVPTRDVNIWGKHLADGRVAAAKAAWAARDPHAPAMFRELGAQVEERTHTQFISDVQHSIWKGITVEVEAIIALPPPSTDSGIGPAAYASTHLGRRMVRRTAEEKARAVRHAQGKLHRRLKDRPRDDDK